MEFTFNVETGDKLEISVAALHPAASLITAHFLDEDGVVA